MKIQKHPTHMYITKICLFVAHFCVLYTIRFSFQLNAFQFLTMDLTVRFLMSRVKSDRKRNVYIIYKIVALLGEWASILFAQESIAHTVLRGHTAYTYIRESDLLLP